MMRHNILARGQRLYRGLVLGLCVLALSGCASTLSARVTSYQKWPADAAGQTYHVVPGAMQKADDLEFQAVADMVRAAIGPTGLVEAPAGQAARFGVHLHYKNPTTEVWAQRYADGFYPGFAPFFGYYGRRGGMFYSPPIVNVPVKAYENTLVVSITDNSQGGIEVYRSTAVSAGSQDNLIAVMPYLSQAVFDGFPGNNGQVRHVDYAIQH